MKCLSVWKSLFHTVWFLKFCRYLQGCWCLIEVPAWTQVYANYIFLWTAERTEITQMITSTLHWCEIYKCWNSANSRVSFKFVQCFGGIRSPGPAASLILIRLWLGKLWSSGGGDYCNWRGRGCWWGSRLISSSMLLCGASQIHVYVHARARPWVRAW